MDLTVNNAQPVAVISPHPFLVAKDRDLIYEPFYPGETIGQYIQRLGLTRKFGLDGRRPVVCTIQGARVPQNMWPHIRPKQGTLIEFRAIVRGGSNGGKLGRTIGAIIVAAASFYTGGAVGAAYGSFWGAAASAAVTVIGGIVINKLFPPPKPHLPNNEDVPPTYAIEGGSNQMRRYDPMVKIIGTHKVFPDFGAQPYNELSGDDQFGFYLFNLGYNNLNLTDFKLGDTSISSYTGLVLEEAGSSGEITLFPGNVDSTAGAELTAAAGWIQLTSAVDATMLAVEIAGLLFLVTDAGDITNHHAVIEINYRRVGVAGWTSVTLRDDTNPLQIDWRGVNASIARQAREYIQNVGSAPGQIALWNGTRKPIRRTYTWAVAKGQYEVRVRKVSADSTDEKIVVDLTWAQLRTYQPDTADYGGQRRLGLQVRATGQVSGSLPAFSCIARAKTATFGGGYALDFDASVQNVSTPNIELTATENLSMECWVNADTVAGAAGATAVLWQGSGSGRAWVFIDSNTGVIRCNTYWGGPDFHQFSTVDARTGWHHVVMTCDRSGMQTLYVDGVQVTQTSMTPAAGIPWDTASTLQVAGLLNHRLDGRVDGVRVYKRVLTPTEVLEHYNGIFRDDYKLVLKWEFDEGTGTVADDSSNTGNDGTITGSPTFVPDPETWGVRETSNPAWWYYECATGKNWNGKKVYGGNVAASRMDVEGIKAFADWCDSQGLTINCVLESQQSVFDVLQLIALMGRATPSWGSGKLGVVWDAPDQPVTAVFGMHNIVSDSFEIQYATEDIADVIEAEFINPNLDWQRDFVRVVVPGATEQTNVRRLQLFGRTSETLAAQDANLYAASNAYRTRSYKWTTDWEGMPCARGDVVQLSHDLASLDYSGRLVEGSTDTQLKLPKEVPLYASGAFIVIVNPDDGTFATYQVQGGSGTTDTLDLVSALPFNPGTNPDHPVYDYKWMYGPTATPGRKVKIESFRPVDERYVEITAIDEDPFFYTAKDNPYTYSPPKPIFGATPVISEITLTPEGVKAGKGYLVKVLIEWEIQGRHSFSDVRVAIGEGSPVTIASSITGTMMEFTMTDRQDLYVEITTYSDLGRIGSFDRETISQFIDFTGSRAPSNVPGFFLSGKLFTWEPAPEVDVIGYHLRFHLGSKATWENALPLHEGIITEHDWEAATLPLDDEVVTYLIKAVDAAGQESEEASIIIQGLGDPDIDNVLEVQDERDLGWPGTITNGTVVSGSIEADSSTDFYGPSDTATFYKASDASVFYDPDTYSALTYETEVIVPVAPLIGSAITVQHVLQGEPHHVYWRQDGIGPFYSADDSDAFYTSDSDPLYDIGEYIPWTGQRIIEPGDRYQFKLTAAGGGVQGVFSEFLVSIDAPDKEEEMNNISISPSGTRLPITVDFTSIKSVQGTLEDDGSDAITFEIVDRDADLGPLIRALDADKIAVSGRGDFRVKGW